ncbi:MAG TPA: hypothetical protein DCW90_23070 [Lachnospiraceae bacterium]|nr:hypothetical protein [Lachnospiraceae bacterium]
MDSRIDLTEDRLFRTNFMKRFEDQMQFDIDPYDLEEYWEDEVVSYGRKEVGTKYIEDLFERSIYDDPLGSLFESIFPKKDKIIDDDNVKNNLDHFVKAYNQTYQYYSDSTFSLTYNFPTVTSFTDSTTNNTGTYFITTSTDNSVTSHDITFLSDWKREEKLDIFGFPEEGTQGHYNNLMNVTRDRVFAQIEEIVDGKDLRDVVDLDVDPLPVDINFVTNTAELSVRNFTTTNSTITIRFQDYEISDFESF